MRILKVLSIVAIAGLFAACSSSGKLGFGKSGDRNDSVAAADRDGVSVYRGGSGSGSAFAGRTLSRDELLAYRSVYFCFDSNSVVSSAANPQPRNCNVASGDYTQVNAHDIVNAYAVYLVQNPGAKIRLEGNTDIRGSREYNIALGERRSLAVADLLQIEGVRPNQIDIISYGKEQPTSYGDTEDEHSKNRRVDFSLEG